VSGSPFFVWSCLGALYVLFLLWYGGRGSPLTEAEKADFLAKLRACAESESESDHEHVADVGHLIEHDDGREFVMHNVIRYRAKALYPPAYAYDGSAPAADRRYFKALLPHLLRYGCVPVFVARRCGEFVEPDGIDRWDMVAMVRYRSRRDFLRFAVAVTREHITVHKWAAIENTQIFPVRPLLSLVFVRCAVAAALAAAGCLVRLLG
jgi:hypothetical protein